MIIIQSPCHPVPGSQPHLSWIPAESSTARAGIVDPSISGRICFEFDRFTKVLSLDLAPTETVEAFEGDRFTVLDSPDFCPVEDFDPFLSFTAPCVTSFDVFLALELFVTLTEDVVLISF